MAGGTVTIDAKSLADLSARMASVSQLCGRSMRAVTFRTAREMGFQLAAFTPPAKRLTPADPANPDERGKPRVWAWVRPRGKALPRRLPVSIETAEKHGLRRRTPYGWKGNKKDAPTIGWAKQRYDASGQLKVVGRGFAKAAWFAAMTAAGLGTKGGAKVMAALPYARGRQEDDGARAAIELVNSIPYIGAMDAGENGNPPANILQRAVIATTAVLDGDIAKLKAKIEAGWQGGATT